MKPGGGRMKGAAFEREVAALLLDELGIAFKREIEQYRQSDLGDLRPVECDNWPFVIECKRYASGKQAKDAWWEQACTAARAADLLPCLIYKYDRSPIKCVVPIAAFAEMCEGTGTYDWKWKAELDFNVFCFIAREMLCDASIGFIQRDRRV